MRVNNPVTKRSMKGRFLSKYNFGDIVVGHVHLFTGLVQDYERVRTAACQFAKRNGMKFTISKSDLGLEIRRIK